MSGPKAAAPSDTVAICLSHALQASDSLLMAAEDSQGHPGTGKSTLAASLARALRWALIDKDDIRDALEACLTSQVLGWVSAACSPLMKHALGADVRDIHARGQAGCLTTVRVLQVPAAALNTCSYDAMWRVADRQLSGGNSVVVDCPLARRQLYDDGCRLAAQVGAWHIPTHVIEFAAPRPLSPKLRCSTELMSSSWRQSCSRRSGGGGSSFGVLPKKRHVDTSPRAGSSFNR